MPPEAMFGLSLLQVQSQRVAASCSSWIDSSIASSGADAKISRSLVGALAVSASSGCDVEVTGIQNGKVTVRASSGSEMSVAATQRAAGHASSGSDVLIRGCPALVQMERGSGRQGAGVRAEFIRVQVPAETSKPVLLHQLTIARHPT
jgi:hypothetical protein